MIFIFFIHLFVRNFLFFHYLYDLVWGWAHSWGVAETQNNRYFSCIFSWLFIYLGLSCYIYYIIHIICTLYNLFKVSYLPLSFFIFYKFSIKEGVQGEPWFPFYVVSQQTLVSLFINQSTKEGVQGETLVSLIQNIFLYVS